MIQDTSLLNINDNPTIPLSKHPSNFGYTLFNEQLQVVYLMDKLEQQKSITCSRTSYNLVYNTLKLGACLSFGKTLVTLALIKLNTQPIKREWYTLFDKHPSSPSEVSNITGKVLRTKFIDTNLIIVSQSVYHQWQQHAIKCGLSVLNVETNIDFRSLCILFINDRSKIEAYDIVLLIYKHLPDDSLPFGTPSLNYDKRTTIHVLSLLSLNVEWKRVIIDDFDTINIGKDMCIPSRITWLISTTNNNNGYRYKLPNTLSDIVAINHNIMDNSKDPMIKDLTIRADLNMSLRLLPKIVHTTYTFLDAYLLNRIINDMAYSPEVIERLNSGDISGAASLLGITVQCHTSGEFLSCILEKNKTAYYESITTCRRFERILNTFRDNELFIERRTHECTPLVNLYERVSQSTDEEFNVLLDTLVLSVSDEQYLVMILGRSRANVTRCINILQRLKRNIEDGECQKCLLEPEGNKYILNCCNIVLCNECMTLPNGMFLDRCPNCLTILNRGSIIEVPESLSLEQFLEYDIDKAIDDIEQYHEQDHNKPTREPIVNPNEDSELTSKSKALIAIIKGTEPTNASAREVKNITMDGVMSSGDIVDINADKTPKYLVFTKWASCANELQDILKVRGINSVILRGTSKTIKKTINTFKTDPTVNVMFMYSTAYCAGLNLEFATHMIFYHSILERAVITQLIGRAQRLGRKESLQLIYLKNKGERYL